MVVHKATAHLRFPDNATPYCRQVVARDMVARGGNFLAAAILLEQHQGHPYVCRHNFCQGLEVLMKGLLLIRDFDAYWPRMRGYGHKLLPVCDAAAEAYAVAPPTGDLRDEIEHLSRFYQQHWLRYASGVGGLIDARSLRYERTLSRLAAIERLIVRYKVIHCSMKCRTTPRSCAHDARAPS